MKRSLWFKSIAAALILTMTVPLFACDETPDEDTSLPVTDEVTESDAIETEPVTESDSATDNVTEPLNTESESAASTEAVTEDVSSSEAESSSLNSTEAETETETETESQIDPSSIIYADGNSIDGAGDGWNEEVFALTDITINESAAVTVSASELLELLASKNGVSEGQVYRVTEPIVLESNTKYYGNLAAVIAEGGIIIKDAEQIVVKELIIKGSINVENSTGIILFRLNVTAKDVGIAFDDKCHDIAVKSCRVHADSIALKIDASLSTIYQNYLCADRAVVCTGDDMAAQNNRIIALSLGISSVGSDCIVRNNSIYAMVDGVGIDFASGSYNGLIALNTITGAQLSIRVTEAYNCSVILNSAIRLSGENNTSLYFIDNKLGGAIELSNNKYLICDGNTFTNDQRPHPVISVGNTECNGDGLHNVNARLELGADEDLLPHTNKDLFIGMERSGTVRDVSQPKNYSLNAYIRTIAKNNDVVIIPPGAYSISSTLNIQSSHSNTTLYAYGVYQEATSYIQNIYLTGANNVTIKGLATGYADQSAGQMQVLEKLGDNKLLVIASAGFDKDFGKTDSSRFSGDSGCYLFHAGSYTSWTEIGAWGKYTVIPNENGEIFNDDGTFTIQIGGRLAAKYYASIGKGEIFTCRLNETNDRTVSITSCNNILFKDTATYGYADALCFVIGGTSKGVKFYRHHNLAHSAYEIDKETYDKYVALEEEYGVDLEVYIDELGRYRGSDSRIGSVDATHVVASSEGLTAISSLFENACDDASNQRGDSSCLHAVIDNKDGTSTIVYKANIAETYYNMYKAQGKTQSTGIETRNFVAGDKIFIYASNGKILCDTTVLSDAVLYQQDKYVMYEEDYVYNGQELHWVWSCYLYAVNVKTADLNPEALDGYELGNDSPSMDNKIIVDNLSRNSVGFTFDNCMIRNNRGRIVVKTRDAIISNCTFKDTSLAGIVLSVESTWGESSVPRNVRITNCLFDGTSQTVNMENNTKYAAIAIEGLGSGGADVTVSNETIPAKSITIEGNVFKNVLNNYYITVSAAQGVTISNNVFEPRDSESSKKIGKTILINGCMDVKISDNTYSDYAEGDMTKLIVANNYKNLFGNDVEGFFEKDKEPQTESAE